MDRNAIKALAEKVGEAREGSTELDARVWCALNGKRFKGAWEDERGPQALYTEPPKRTERVSRPGLVHSASRSLDAALVLAEEHGFRPEDLLPEAVEGMLVRGYRPNQPMVPQLALAVLYTALSALDQDGDGE